MDNKYPKTYREWCAELEKLTTTRLNLSLTNIPEVTNKDMEEAFHDGSTPEEFYEVDIIDQGARYGIQTNRRS
jgi:hypothetical protein